MNSKKLKGSVANKCFMEQKPPQQLFILGASSGIGLALARSLKSRYHLTLGSRRTDLLKKEFPEALVLSVDVRQPLAVQEAFATLYEKQKALDILIYSAGIGIFKTVEQLQIDEFRQMWETNLLGAFVASQEALKYMKTQHSGLILFLNSLAGKMAFGGGAGYNASKFGLSGFSEALMMEAREYGIRVVTLFPGSVNTPFHDQSPFHKKRNQMLEVDEVATFIASLLELPPHFLCDQITFRPLLKKGIT
jgi:3-oxoacyl-[acyl-carrier protein] reductase